MSYQTSIYGKYFLLDRIAVGGMAEVFKAKTFGVRGFERLLVIKRILPHLSKDEEFVEMFIDEAKISVELTHANICQVTDLGKIGDNYFIAMEFIDGKDLRAILKKCYSTKKPVTVPQALYLSIEALKGLDYAHRKTDSTTGKKLNVIHRDISPQNIMVSYDADVKIVDFGIAKTEFKLNQTQAGVLKGKFGYMSPEQASGLEVDLRTDVFSAGIILYESLTGRRLFLGDTDFDTLEKIKECVVPSPTKYNPAITPELEEIIYKALAREREDRYASAQELQMALSKIFYTQYQEYSPKELSTFLHELFAQEIADEQESLRRAIDALPPEELAAATSAAEAANDRLVESGSRRRSSSGRIRSSTIGAPSSRASKPSPLGILGRWFPSIRESIVFRNSLLILASAILGGFIYLKWLAPSGTPPTDAKNGQTSQPGTEENLVSVKITSQPDGASIFVNNEPAGTTPADLRLVAGRAYRLRMEKEGYTVVTEEILVSKDQPTLGPFPLSAKEPDTGTLRVESDPPGAAISLDGKKTKFRTPADIPDLALGDVHRLRINLEGHTSISKRVVLRETEEELRVTLTRSVVTLRVDVQPENAQLFIDGKERGHVIENLETGKTYQLKVTARGYHSIKRKITLSDPREYLSLQLKKIEKAFGTISLGASPWAIVLIDGKEIGQTPLIDQKLSVGSHKVVFRNPDHKPCEKTVKVKKGKNSDLRMNLRSCSKAN